MNINTKKTTRTGVIGLWHMPQVIWAASVCGIWQISREHRAGRGGQTQFVVNIAPLPPTAL